MIFKKFNIQLSIRVLMLVLNCIAIAYSSVVLSLIILPVGLLIIGIVQVMELNHFLNITNRSLIKFLKDIKYQDLSAGYGLKKYGKTFEELENTYASVLHKMKDISHEKEAYLELLNSIVEQIDVGLIVVDEKDDVKLMNSIASSFLNVPNYKKWERFRERIPQFSQFVENLENNQSAILTIKQENEKLSLSITRTQLIQLEIKLTIITIVSIGSHLGKKEVEAYNNLISVLTHEIMNTISPIVSLSKIVEEKLQNEKDEDVKQSIQVIGDRSEGLLNFVRNYRKISKIPEPELSSVGIQSLFEKVKTLMEQNIGADDSIIINCIPKNIEISLDKLLIEQSLINLVKNSVEAKKKGQALEIQLLAYQKGTKRFIEVKDNGEGIPPEVQKDVLIPFYTSKEEGTGIGLSIVNQIMMNHNGSLHFTSNTEGSSFVLTFRG